MREEGSRDNAVCDDGGGISMVHRCKLRPAGGEVEFRISFKLHKLQGSGSRTATSSGDREDRSLGATSLESWGEESREEEAAILDKQSDRSLRC